MTERTESMIERIAYALERQVAQTDEMIAQRTASEATHLARLNANREADLARLTQEHAEMTEQNAEYARAIYELRDLLKARESATKAAAIDPVDGRVTE